MFGLSFGEILLLLIVGLVVVGPRNLPTLMRTAGRWVAKARRMSSELRAQSGIDDIIRNEGNEKEISELRSLSRMNVIDTLVKPAAAGGAAMATRRKQLEAKAEEKPADLDPKTPAPMTRREPPREREFPTLGCDAYGALPDDATPYIPEPAAAHEAPPEASGTAS